MLCVQVCKGLYEPVTDSLYRLEGSMIRNVYIEPFVTSRCMDLISFDLSFFLFPM